LSNKNAGGQNKQHSGSFSRQKEHAAGKQHESDLQANKERWKLDVQ
jgi:hypothetical protein